MLVLYDFIAPGNRVPMARNDASIALLNAVKSMMNERKPFILQFDLMTTINDRIILTIESGLTI